MPRPAAEECGIQPHDGAAADCGRSPRPSGPEEHRSQWTCSSSVLLIKTSPPLDIIHGSGAASNRTTWPRPSAECRRSRPQQIAAANSCCPPQTIAESVRRLRPPLSTEYYLPRASAKYCRRCPRIIAAAADGILPRPNPSYRRGPVQKIAAGFGATSPRLSADCCGYLRNVAAAARALSSPRPTIPPEPTARARGNAVSNSLRRLTRRSPASDKPWELMSDNPRECLARQPAALNSFLARGNPASTRGNAPSHSRGNINCRTTRGTHGV